MVDCFGFSDYNSVFSASVYGFDLEKLGGSRDIEVEIIKSEFERRIGGNLFYSDEYLQLVRSDIVRMIENAPQDFLAESQFLFTLTVILRNS